MISSEELKRLQMKSTRSPWHRFNIYDWKERLEINITRFDKSTDVYFSKHDEELVLYLRNHCEEIIKILEERE